VSVSAGAGAGSPADGSIAVSSNGAPLRIKEVWPSGYVSQSVSNILVSFCSPLASSSVEADVSLSGPQGDVPVEVLAPNPFSLSLDLAVLDVAEGEYALVVGTNVSTINGGVLERSFTNRFVIDVTAPNAPLVTGFIPPPATNALTNAFVTLHRFLCCRRDRGLRHRLHVSAIHRDGLLRPALYMGLPRRLRLWRVVSRLVWVLALRVVWFLLRVVLWLVGTRRLV
jgi:hypothetical protein